MSKATQDPWLALCLAAGLDPATEGRERLEAAFGEAAFDHDALDRAAFGAHVGRKISSESDPLATLATLHVDDLWLAFACAHGAPDALSHFERELGDDIARGVTQAGPDHAGQDAGQLVRQKLFVSEPGGAPKILDYAGRGTLRSWVRITAVRTSLNLERSRRRRPDQPSPQDEYLVHAEAEKLDPELAYLKRHYSAQFKQAFEQGVAQLSDRHRNVLRLHLIERLNIDEISAANGVHRATAARWIVAARAALVAQVRQVMTQHFGVPGEQLDSVMRLVQSQLDLSVHRILGDSSTTRS